MAELAVPEFAITPTTEFSVKELHDGHQVLFRFANGFGASVVRHSFSYGGKSGLFELGMIRWLDDGWEFAGQTSGLTPFINDDVAGWLDVPQVEELLLMIESLPTNFV